MGDIIKASGHEDFELTSVKELLKNVNKGDYSRVPYADFQRVAHDLYELCMRQKN